MQEINMEDRRKLRLEDRLKHLAIQLDILRICLNMCGCDNPQMSIIDKCVQLCIGDLSHLIEDMNGIKEKEIN